MDDRVIEILKKEEYVLVDVREQMELMMDGQFDQALHIPLAEIPAREDEILAHEKPVIFFCRSGVRSGKALEHMLKSGLKNGYNGGGYLDLKQVFESM